LNTRSGNKERISRIYQMHANKIQSILSKQEILSGSGFKDIKTGDTLCDENTQLFLSQ
jgi:elongation factor G